MSNIVFDSDSESVSDSLDLFTVPSHQLAVENFFPTEVLATHPLSNASTQIVFDVPLSDEYSDLDQSLLVVKVRIKNADGTNLGPFVGNTPANPTAANSVAFVNNSLNSLFSGVDIKLNGVSVNSNFFTNPFVTYIQTILSYGYDAFESKLALGGWEIEEDLEANAAEDGAEADTGFYRRAQKTRESRVWTLSGPLHSSITLQNRYILPLVPISITLTKSRPEFCLHSNSQNPNYLIEITSAKIIIKRVKILSTYKLRIENELLKNEALYPLKTFECRPYSLDAGVKSFTFSNLYPTNSTIPDHCVVGFLRQTDFSGDIHHSCYRFDHFSLEEVSISFDQHRFAYECQYDDVNGIDYVSSYQGLFLGNGSKSNSGLTITYEKFAKGFALYSFLVACTRLYNPLCRSVGLSVGLSVTFYFFYQFYLFKSFLVILSHLKSI